MIPLEDFTDEDGDEDENEDEDENKNEDEDEVILWWNLSRDESYLVMKAMIVKEVMTGDVSPVAMFNHKVMMSCVI